MSDTESKLNAYQEVLLRRLLDVVEATPNGSQSAEKFLESLLRLLYLLGADAVDVEAMFDQLRRVNRTDS